MNKLTIALLIALSTTAHADKQRLGEGIGQKQVEAAKGMIRYSGYKCDYVDAMNSHAFSVGFTVVCNDYQYRYELKDVGGNWRVTVK